MSFLKQDSLLENGVTVQKEVQMILERRGLWPTGGLNLVCPTPKCPACHLITKCKACVKGSRCSSCIEKKTYSSRCIPKRACNECCRRKERYIFVFKNTVPGVQIAQGRNAWTMKDYRPNALQMVRKHFHIYYYFKI